MGVIALSGSVSALFLSQKNQKALATPLIAVYKRYTTTITMPSRRSQIRATKEREEDVVFDALYNALLGSQRS